MHSIVFLRHVLSAEGISANPKKVEKIKIGQCQPTQKNYNHFWGWPPYYSHFIQRFTAIAKCLHQLAGPANHQKSKKNKKNN